MAEKPAATAAPHSPPAASTAQEGQAKVKAGVVKMDDIARMAGVSKSTVSRALSGSPLVNEETRVRIQALVESHSYRVDTRAQGLRKGQTRTIAVVIPLLHEHDQPISDPFFLELLGHIADAVADHGYDLLLSKIGPGRASGMTDLVDTGRVDGLIAIGQSTAHLGLEQLAARNLPLVVWGAQLADQHYVTVGSDNRAGAERAVSHLIAQGRRRIVFLGQRSVPEMRLRHDGYVAALEAAGITPDPALDVPTRFASAAALTAMRSLLCGGASFDAVFACSDVIAISAIRALQDQGLTVPEDVAVVGYDDIQMAAFYNPALTTVRQDTATGGRLLVDLLFAQIAGRSARSVMLPTELVVRASSGTVSGTTPPAPR
ncbi:LacI family DNA-binding transcriptional regulator [Nitrospirillum iridis]|uniref:DNA-binding LacI/PurR family transcriptional regulator n=1 Tax=Nitrospirillum iridis TaxID=765888 RepID=A0A7X0B1S3_9PROT|nr:LacI family DNA-binding transcriptional regulator [Nitrospirillum iridis]MBB6253772.1 DNA-binding LacI/PurR family transcriptional regulator [Nitrospirillum iridis]